MQLWEAKGMTVCQGALQKANCSMGQQREAVAAKAQLKRMENGLDRLVDIAQLMDEEAE
jgi:hypothetical protein